jgi:hypothetical protein
MFYRFLLSTLTLALISALPLAQSAKLNSANAVIPDEVSAEITGSLNEKGFVVSVDGQETASFWFREEPQLAASPSSELGVTFGQLEPGSLLGVVKLAQPWLDYKASTIPAGVFTMRYGVMPADGNHMGVSIYRDYLLLIPANQDTNPDETFSYVELLTSSVEASGVPHPAVLALFPIWEEITEPTLLKNEMDQWTLAVKLGEQVLGLVIVGHGEV